MNLLVAALLIALSTAGHAFDLGGDKTPQNGSFEMLENRLADVENSIINLLNQRLMLEQLLSKQTKNRIIQGCDEVDSSGRYRLRLPSTTFGVICDARSFDGGWLVIQQRLSGKLSFDRDWDGYRDGFGIVGSASDFWLGLEKIHQITSGGDFELAVELRNEFGTYGFALHSAFNVAGEDELYRLTCSGTEAGNLDGRMGAGHGELFTTRDLDFDKLEDVNCGQVYGSGWWFYDCNNVNLNGPYKKDNATGRGIYWRGFTDAATPEPVDRYDDSEG
ncbi:hypothetical protein pipiens_005231 [Culex pipiens pipiens]|uniref:Fibrinogen C-terminal domain-containing protein n=1 Tax=Culex pipiens pipiens TaxID=38569 RepID=A0ABD1E2Z3_CULPP